MRIGARSEAGAMKAKFIPGKPEVAELGILEVSSSSAIASLTYIVVLERAENLFGSVKTAKPWTKFVN